MKLLETIYKVRGRIEWTYKIVKRENDVVLAETHRDNRIEANGGVMDDITRTGHEVYIVQKYPERPRPAGSPGPPIPAREAVPPDYYWGRYGFSFNGDAKGLAIAEERFQELLKMQESKPERSAKLAEAKAKKLNNTNTENESRSDNTADADSTISEATAASKGDEVDKPTKTKARTKGVGSEYRDKGSKGGRVSKK